MKVKIMLNVDENQFSYSNERICLYGRVICQ